MPGTTGTTGRENGGLGDHGYWGFQMIVSYESYDIFPKYKEIYGDILFFVIWVGLNLGPKLMAIVQGESYD